MPLEATIIIIDNSEYMRNGDYPPNRFEAQADAVNTVFQTKIDSNPENSVGIMTMAGKGPEVLITNTKVAGQIHGAIRTASNNIGGLPDIPTAIAVAQLALKHRQNKNLRQRIVLFVASPLDGQGVDERIFIKLAKKLKKNNVAVDVIAFGDSLQGTTSPLLEAFVENVTSSENSHLLLVSPGPHLLSDSVIDSAILAADRGVPDEALGHPQTSASAGTTNFEFGVDPSLDPELAMALRMSMEEEQARQAAAAQHADTVDSSSPHLKRNASETPLAPPTEEAEPEEGDAEQAILQQALAMSSGPDVEMSAEGQHTDDEDMSEDEAIARAIEMSMKDNDADKKDS